MEISGFDLDSFLQKYKITIIFVLFGLIFLGIGALTIKKLFPEESKVEISSLVNESKVISAESSQVGKIFVDVAGGVIKPGVYELEIGSRVNDLLILAGGLSEKADRDWVAKNINLAQKLIDGAKIYVPKVGEVTPFSPSTSLEASEGQGKININTATEKELDTLWGIGEATAQKIISGRPYQKPEDLLYKKIIKSNVWEAIKDKVIVY